MSAPAISYRQQAERIELTILGKRANLEQREAVKGNARFPDHWFDDARATLAELEAAHVTLLRVCAKTEAKERAAA